jgi:hypothetical protein
MHPLFVIETIIIILIYQHTLHNTTTTPLPSLHFFPMPPKATSKTKKWGQADRDLLPDLTNRQLIDITDTTWQNIEPALERWLDEVDTDPDLTDSIVECVQWRGTVTMEEATIDAPFRFRHMALSQDKIGWRWRRFLEGMISTEITSIQGQYIAVNGSHMSLNKWCTGLITRLLDIMHGQWLYRNYIVHDPVFGTIATAKKEELLEEIERQRDLGDAGLLEEDKYLAEVNLEEMASSSPGK